METQPPHVPEQSIETPIDTLGLLIDTNPVTVSESKRRLGTGEEVGLLEARPAYPLDIPTIIAPGFSETLHTVRDLTVGLAKHGGRQAIAFAQPRRGGHEPLADMRETGYASEYIERAERLLQMLIETDMKQVDIIAHSQGCIDAVVAALMAHETNPGLIRNIVLVNPAGAIGTDHGAIRTVIRSLHEIVEDTKVAAHHPSKLPSLARALQGAVKYILPNPLRAVGEARATLRTDIRAGLQELRRQEVGIALVAGVDDELFPMDEFQHSITTDEVDGFYSVKGGHNEDWLRPEKHAPALASILDSLHDLADRRDHERHRAGETTSV